MKIGWGIFIYCLMMVLLGATIGIIAGLSITSVTGTVIEIVTSVVAGSAGLYFLSPKREGDDRHGAGLIGSVGALFLAAFWVAYHVSGEHRYEGTGHYQWESGSLHRNVALAEIYGHAQKLGIAREDLAQELAVSTRLLHKSWHVVVTQAPAFSVARAWRSSPSSLSLLFIDRIALPAGRMMRPAR